jgi:antitoxin component of MazEF toxin-antitoxin module
LIVTIPAAWAEQNGLDAGSSVGIELSGAELTLRALHASQSLETLLAQTPRGARRAKGWDELAPVGREL